MREIYKIFPAKISARKAINRSNGENVKKHESNELKSMCYYHLPTNLKNLGSFVIGMLYGYLVAFQQLVLRGKSMNS